MYTHQLAQAAIHRVLDRTDWEKSRPSFSAYTFRKCGQPSRASLFFFFFFEIISIAEGSPDTSGAEGGRIAGDESNVFFSIIG
jgi:hypothetical protein